MVDVIEALLKIGLAVGLVIAWGTVLLPPLMRLLGGVGRSADSIGSFRDKMSVLGSSSPAGRRGPAPVARGPVLDLRTSRPSATAAPRPRSSVKKRRRDILVGLLSSTGVTFLLAVVLGGAAWLLFGLSVVLLAGYVALLWSVQQAALERQRKVAYMPTRAPATTEAPALRPVGSTPR